jgi:nucleotide-binding universal stress UspA family protein
MGRHITLVGIDYSTQSQIALETAAGIARAADGELHVAHVITPSFGAYPSDGSLSATIYTPENDFVVWLAKVGEETRLRMPQFCEEVLKEMPGQTTGHVRVGRPDQHLVQLARELQADLLVVGTHGRTGLERMVLGSVAERVVRSAPCPVLVARARETVAVELEGPCPQCLEVRGSTEGHQTWCTRHSTHHPRAHSYSEYPPSFAMGSLTIRF